MLSASTTERVCTLSNLCLMRSWAESQNAMRLNLREIAGYLPGDLPDWLTALFTGVLAWLAYRIIRLKPSLWLTVDGSLPDILCTLHASMRDKDAELSIDRLECRKPRDAVIALPSFAPSEGYFTPRGQPDWDLTGRVRSVDWRVSSGEIKVFDFWIRGDRCPSKISVAVMYFVHARASRRRTQVLSSTVSPKKV
jgi:hypothetical protein